ncbi:AraC family transcriptional regulator [Streptomyces yaizuensis]|uniref:Helix-turn-helix transcriptional regulator n=1 Tax=Streptomyces yaizuensis TaxID=2989713 RepID=A0ABQ5P979_9ACTN|nr:AraC family transcriptional regulator [Streptomyces sp. YSPA8]GLF98796.1 helix-turn-helix transcriptional regulator [Streptomyces sp. YSPA8]
METTVERAVTRVISSMHENLGQELTIDDMAETAMYSKFHFTRIFKGMTGTTPGRFLSALRLQEAKRLLVTTELNITDISNLVGYQSVGTFSSRFKSSVGMAPTTYRQLGGFAEVIHTDHRRPTNRSRPLAIQGTVFPPLEGGAGFVFIGLFPDCIPQGQPVRCTVLDRPGDYILEDVPEGTWHVLTQSVPYGMEEHDGIGKDAAPSIGSYGPVTVSADTLLKPAHIQLRSMRALDPPVLLALLDMRMTALAAVAV